ncbi:DUF397 domain-containing protein [Streptomyces sp. NPDC005728]|uniref:DUF397 domain-containing protein n=1 Tax=Streptomyces sp. NPDC005728 TaxID=3157054 RepID=UPI00340176E4
MDAKATALYALDLSEAQWATSSTCPPWGGGSCLEVADLGGGARAVRDSKNPALPALRFTAGEWTDFTDAVRNGEFV